MYQKSSWNRNFLNTFSAEASQSDYRNNRKHMAETAAEYDRYGPEYIDFVTKVFLVYRNIMLNAGQHKAAKLGVAGGTAFAGYAIADHVGIDDDIGNAIVALGADFTPDELHTLYEQYKDSTTTYQPHVTTGIRVAAAGSNPDISIIALAQKHWKQMIETIGGTSLFMGCTDRDDGDGTKTDIKELGSYLIKGSNDRYGMDPNSEDKVNAYLEKVLEETSEGPLFEITRMDYTEEPEIEPTGIIKPTQTPTIESTYEHALNADKLAMDMLIKYLNDGDMGDRNIEDFIDDKSLDIIEEIKEDNINIVHYAITLSKHDQNGVKYLKNEFETEDGEYGHILMEVVNMGDKENPNWMPSKIMDYQIYSEYIPLSANPEDFVTTGGNYKMLEKSTIKLGWGFMSNGGDDDHFLNENKADIGSGVVYDGKNLFQITFYNEKAFKDSNKVMDTSMTGRTENPDDLIKDTDDAEWTNEWALIDSDPKAHDTFYYKITQLTPRVDSVARKIDIGDDEIATGVFKLEDEGA